MHHRPGARHRRSAARIGILLAAAMTVACSEPVTTSTEPPPTTVDIVVTSLEWRFVPASVTATAGEPLTIELQNDGAIIHDWTVLREPITNESEYREDIRIAGVTAQPGATERLTFDVPAPGEYQVVCTIPGHFSSGMAGTLTVLEG